MTLWGSWPFSHFSKGETVAEDAYTNLIIIIQLVIGTIGIQCQVCPAPKTYIWPLLNFPSFSAFSSLSPSGLLCDSKRRDELDIGIIKFGTNIMVYVCHHLYCLSKALYS